MRKRSDKSTILPEVEDTSRLWERADNPSSQKLCLFRSSFQTSPPIQNLLVSSKFQNSPASPNLLGAQLGHDISGSPKILCAQLGHTAAASSDSQRTAEASKEAPEKRTREGRAPGFMQKRPRKPTIKRQAGALFGARGGFARILRCRRGVRHDVYTTWRHGQGRHALGGLWATATDVSRLRLLLQTLARRGTTWRRF